MEVSAYKYSIKWSSQFKKDYKKAMKRKLDIALIDNIIRKLATGLPLPPEYKDHALTGNWENHRECHIQNAAPFSYNLLTK